MLRTGVGLRLTVDVNYTGLAAHQESFCSEDKKTYKDEGFVFVMMLICVPVTLATYLEGKVKRQGKRVYASDYS